MAHREHGGTIEMAMHAKAQSDAAPDEPRVDEPREGISPQEKTAEHLLKKEDPAFYRRVRRAVDGMVFRYGELAPDHPTQAYAAEAARALPMIGDFPLVVKVLPDLKHANACAFPDGTVFVVRGLFQSLKTRETLQGVIGHEHAHVYRQHTRKQEVLIEDIEKALEAGRFPSMRQVARTVGLKHAHEWEADFRSYVQSLDEAGINPLGFKLFFEELHARGKGSGLVHGSTMARAMNLDLLTHVIDFQSLGAALTPIPPEIAAALEGTEKKISYAAITRRPKNYGFTAEALREYQAERRA
ncbi:MAG: M48 family metalloprotease, partial [Bdellovibrionota bacterium]